MAFSGIRIAVLGPNLASTSDSGTRKRIQIYEELQAEGHFPFFPEREGELVAESLEESLLEQERRMLSGPDVDLVIILCTSGSFGAGWEIASFEGVPEIKSKTAVLFPLEYYSPDSSLTANTVRAYHAKAPYSNRHFEVCQLVEECKKWANDRQAGNWPGLVPFQF